MKSSKKSKIATLMVHTSPLDQAGVGDAGGMNVYVTESAKKMAQAGLSVDIFTRANKPNLPESIEIADGVTVKHLVAGPFEGLSKEELPSQLGALTSAFMQHQKNLPNDYYSLLHSHYWISGQLGWMISERTNIPFIHTMHTTAKVKNLNLATGEKPEPQIRAIGEEQV
jgi:D-inositol-3-phosphate glycosyltransferase